MPDQIVITEKASQAKEPGLSGHSPAASPLRQRIEHIRTIPKSQCAIIRQGITTRSSLLGDRISSSASMPAPPSASALPISAWNCTRTMRSATEFEGCSIDIGIDRRAAPQSQCICSSSTGLPGPLSSAPACSSGSISSSGSGSSRSTSSRLISHCSIQVRT